MIVLKEYYMHLICTFLMMLIAVLVFTWCSVQSDRQVSSVISSALIRSFVAWRYVYPYLHFTVFTSPLITSDSSDPQTFKAQLDLYISPLTLVIATHNYKGFVCCFRWLQRERVFILMAQGLRVHLFFPSRKRIPHMSNTAIIHSGFIYSSNTQHKLFNPRCGNAFNYCLAFYYAYKTPPKNRLLIRVKCGYAIGNFISNCDIKVKWENTMVFTCKFEEYHGRPICSLIKTTK